MSNLHEDALKLAINKNLSDIRILLQWAEEAREVREKVQHSAQALSYLQEVVETLEGMRQAAPSRMPVLGEDD